MLKVEAACSLIAPTALLNLSTETLNKMYDELSEVWTTRHVLHAEDVQRLDTFMRAVAETITYREQGCGQTVLHIEDKPLLDIDVLGPFEGEQS